MAVENSFYSLKSTEGNFANPITNTIRKEHGGLTFRVFHLC